MTSGANIEAALRTAQVEADKRAQRDRHTLRGDITEVLVTSLHYLERCDEAMHTSIAIEIEKLHDRDVAAERYLNEPMFHAKVEMMKHRLIESLRKNGVNV